MCGKQQLAAYIAIFRGFRAHRPYLCEAQSTCEKLMLMLGGLHAPRKISKTDALEIELRPFQSKLASYMIMCVH